MNVAKQIKHQYGRRRQRGFTMIEVLIAVFILVLMTLMVAAVVPVTMRSVRTSNYYTLAAQVAQRKLDQLMEPQIGYFNMTPTGLAGKVVSGSVSSSADVCEFYDPVAVTTDGTAPVNAINGNPAVGANKTYKMVGYFTKLDGLRTYKSNGTTACSAKLSENTFPGDNDVVGRLDIEGWQGKTATSAEMSMLKATVTITWRITGREKSTYTISTLIPRTSIL